MTRERKLAQLSKHPEVRELLFRAMPQMQPSALKHYMVTSVANVLNNPIASATSPHDGSEHIIGFGDAQRRLPLVIIVEPDGDRSVRHAFPPNMNYSMDKALAVELQRHDDEFSATHNIASRDILSELRSRDRGELSVKGLHAYTDPAEFEKPYWNNYRANFYPTVPLPAEDHFVDKPVMYDTDGDDYWQMVSNIAEGFAQTHPESGVMGVTIDNRSNETNTSRKTMHITDVAMKSDPNVPVRVLPAVPTKFVRRPNDTINFNRLTSMGPDGSPPKPIVMNDLDTQLAKINQQLYGKNPSKDPSSPSFD